MNQSPPTRKRLYYGWVMVVVAFFTLALSAGGLTYSYSVVTVILNREFNVSQFQLMLPVTLMTLAGAVVAPVVGPRLDRYPVRRFMFAGACCMSASLLLMSLAPSMAFITVIYALVMAPVNVLLGTLSSSVLISRWFVRKLALAMGIASVGVSVGGFLIPPLLEALCTTFGWRETFRGLSALVLLILLPLIALVRDRPTDADLPPHIDAAVANQLKRPGKSVFSKTGVILRSRNFWLVGISVGLLFSAYTALLTNLLPIAMLKGISSQQGARLVATISGVAIFGKLAFGAITDRIDLRIGLGVTITLVISGMLIYLLGESFHHFLLGSVVLGLAAGNMLPVWSALIARLFGAADYGRVMGVMSPINVGCNVFAVPLTGFLYDRTGSYTAPLGLFMVLLGMALLFIPAIRYPVARVER